MAPWSITPRTRENPETELVVLAAHLSSSHHLPTRTESAFGASIWLSGWPLFTLRNSPVQLERCHPADPGRRTREATAAAHKLTVSANFKVGDAARGGFAVRAVLHDSPGPALRAPGTPELSGSQGTADTAAAGNEVGITSARGGSRGLPRAHLCTSVTCGIVVVSWWRAHECIPGGQGVAGSNPAVPTRTSRSEAISPVGRGGLKIF